MRTVEISLNEDRSRRMAAPPYPPAQPDFEIETAGIVFELPAMTIRSSPPFLSNAPEAQSPP
jgi:hypothetical protein